MGGTVIVLGAGATKACGGPLTDQILPAAFSLAARPDAGVNQEFLTCAREFLNSVFHVPLNSTDGADYPSLTLILGLIDMAIDRRHNFGSRWKPSDLAIAREAFNYLIFKILDHQLQTLTEPDLHLRLFEKLYASETERATVISLNYDLIADNSLLRLDQDRNRMFAPIDYGCDIDSAPYSSGGGTAGHMVLKLHGSLNWIYCPGCHRLTVGISSADRRMVKVLDTVFHAEFQPEESTIERWYAAEGRACRRCGCNVRPVLISPTHMKDYRNPHIARVWHRAGEELRAADKVIFIGYSLPSDDTDVIYLLKRALHWPNGSPASITVVDYAAGNPAIAEHPVGIRYRSLFGMDIEWVPGGMKAFVDSLPG